VSETIAALAATIAERKAHPREGSYTCELLAAGPTRILKKVGEEAAEVVVAMCATIMKEAMDEAIRRGVPAAAARSFILGHTQIPLAIVFQNSNPFSDAALIAVEYGKRHVLREDWKQVFEPERIQEVLAEMLHLNREAR
jgi:phosphoribosyl-ATP pyrophosphohydrolase